MRWRRILLGGAAVATSMFLVLGFVFPLEKAPEGQWGPFRGQVVDAETGQTIPGAIFVAIWMRTIPTPVHAGQIFNAARVAVADADGRFEIPRRWRPMFSGFIDPVYLVCVAPGYAPYQGGRTGQPSVVRLRPLSAKDRRLAASDSALLSLIPFHKLQGFEKMVNDTRHQLALPPVGLASGNIDRPAR